MNTRLQVEHSVTEAISGIDLVEWQIRIANGERLPLSQEEITQNGHAIEARLYAEDPITFQPQAGVIKHLKLPLEKVRVDTAVKTGDVVSIYYDPMISKLTAHDATRELARSKLLHAIEETEIDGLESNRQFLMYALGHPKFKSANLHTGFVDENANSLLKPNDDPDQRYQALAAILLLKQRFEEHMDIMDVHDKNLNPWDDKAGWRVNGPGLFEIDLSYNGEIKSFLVSIEKKHFQILRPVSYTHLTLPTKRIV